MLNVIILSLLLQILNGCSSSLHNTIVPKDEIERCYGSQIDPNWSNEEYFKKTRSSVEECGLVTKKNKTYAKYWLKSNWYYEDISKVKYDGWTTEDINNAYVIK